jgi:hypothetical protein
MVLLSAIVVGLGLTSYGFAQQGGKNLKILPKTMTKPEIKRAMKGIADALGVQCDHCHDTDDMAKDTPKKERAREMMLMTQNVNKTTFKGKDKVKCVMCHRGKAEPK